MSGEWMKELKRSASERIRGPRAGAANIAQATEQLSRSIKESFRAGKCDITLHMEMSIAIGCAVCIGYNKC